MISDKEKKAIDTFVAIFSGSYKKLDPNDIDYKVFDKDVNIIAYVEVVCLTKTIYSAYPLSITAKKLVKLVDKRLTPVVIWACEDGIIYGKVNAIKAELRWGGSSSPELMAYFDKQKDLKYIRYS